MKSIKFGIQGLVRNPLSSISLLITFLTVNVVMVSAALGVNIFNEIYQNAAGKFTVVIPLKITTPQDQLEFIKNEINRFTEVESTQIISGISEARDFLGDEGILGNDEITDPTVIDDIVNSFPDQIEAELVQNANVPLFLDSLENNNAIREYIDISTTERLYNQTEDEIDTLIDLRDSVALALLVFVIVLGFQCFSAVYNTIQISISSRREEVEIMQLVGANISYIRNPFILESIIIFAVGVTMSSAIIYLLIDRFNVNLSNLFSVQNVGIVNVRDVFNSSLEVLVGFPSLFLLVVTVVASYSSVKKYIKI